MEVVCTNKFKYSSACFIFSILFTANPTTLQAAYNEFLFTDPQYYLEAQQILDSVFKNKTRIQNYDTDADIIKVEEEIKYQEINEPMENEIIEDHINEEPSVHKSNAYLLLVNKSNRIDQNYQPEKTMDIAKYVKSTKSEILLEEEAALRYIEMIEAMEEDGPYHLAAVSGYRSYDYQDTLYQRQISRHTSTMTYGQAARKAGMVVAPPGASEHQTGLAIDVSSKEVGYDLSERFEKTKEYQWLAENAYRYGFIIRYEKSKQDITDIIYEPWHLRFVGDYAEEIYRSGLCLEEFLLANEHNNN